MPADRSSRRGAALTVPEAARRAVRELLRVSGVLDPLAERFRAAGHELFLVGGSVRDALLGRLGDDLDFTTDAPPETILQLVERLGPTWTTGIEFGTVGVQVRTATPLRDHDLPQRGLRRRHPQARGAVRRLDRRRPVAPRLHRQRDGGAVAARCGRPFVDPYGGLEDLAVRLLRTPGRPEQSFDDDPLRMLRAARFAAQLGFAVDAGAVAAITAMAPRLAIVSAERMRDELTKLVLGAQPRRGLQLSSTRGWRSSACRSSRAQGDGRRAPPAQGRLRAHLDGARAGDRARGRTGPTSCCGWPRCCMTSASRRPSRSSPGGKVSFHHHEVVGAAMAKQRLQELRYPVTSSRTSPGWSSCTCVSTVTPAASGPTPRCAATCATPARCSTGCTADPLRLHDAQCAKARALATAYDSLEARIAELAEQEDLERIRPTSTATRS